MARQTWVHFSRICGTRCTADESSRGDPRWLHFFWVHRDRPNLSLLDACQADTRGSLLLDVELKNYQSGSASGGSGPSFADRQRRRHANQINKARSTGK